MFKNKDDVTYMKLQFCKKKYQRKKFTIMETEAQCEGLSSKQFKEQIKLATFDD